jgi:multiple sugar transport system substrate-binding protein
MVAMNALHEFTSGEIQSLGGAGTFLPSAWGNTHLFGQTETWAIPWVTGVRLLFYRRSLLQQAGVDEAKAFQSAQCLAEALNHLHTNGVPNPWTVPTGFTHTTLLNAASWVWEAGGDFLNATARHSVFSQPAARAGLRAYFALGRYIPPAAQHLNGLRPDRFFLDNARTAMTMSGPWLLAQASPELKADLGAALHPGALFVGGSNLVVWRHSPHAEAAIRLIRFLTRPEAQKQYCQRVGLLPVTHAATALPPFSTEPIWQLSSKGLKAGRAFPITRSWGLMEDRLASSFAAIWADAFKTPDPDLDAIISRHLEPLARRLDLVLGQS